MEIIVGCYVVEVVPDYAKIHLLGTEFSYFPEERKYLSPPYNEVSSDM